MSRRTKLNFQLCWKGLVLEVEASYYPGTRDTMYKHNGDPGEPGDPPEVEFEVTSVEIDDAQLVEFELCTAGRLILWDNQDLIDTVGEKCAELLMDSAPEGPEPEPKEDV